MSQISLTNIERQSALERLGYSKREAEFLCTAGLHSGYFLRRQYARFLMGQDGGSVTQLIDKTLGYGHVEAATFKANMYVYHLFARSFYAALGQEDNRNRRRKEPVTIKTKLMGLDFILDNPGHDYLATEREKVEFFSSSFAVDMAVLPAKRYAGRGEMTTRYFVEKYPIYHTPSPVPASPPMVWICFVDPGQASVDGFETFLSRYARLFAQLREFRVIYVAASRALFAKAEAAFERFNRNSATNEIWPAAEQIQEYFEGRRLYESKQLGSFTREKLLRLRDLRLAFSGPKIEDLYRRWKATPSDIAFSNLTYKVAPSRSVSAKFSTYLLGHSYDLFGNLTAN